MADKLYSIKESTLTDIGDALRRKHGETRIETIVEEQEFSSKISKTPNATGFDSWEGDYGVEGASETYDVITIEGATKLHVKMAYQTVNKTYCYIQIKEGAHNSYFTTTKYGGSTLSTVELDFENTDTITFRFYDTPSASKDYLGYYAEITGYDANGNVLSGLVEVEKEVEVPNTYSSNEMAQAIDNIEVGEVLPEEAFIISGICNYRFSGGGWDWFINLYKDKITTNNITSCNYMFNGCGIEYIPFEINFKENTKISLDNIFYSCLKLKTLPKLNNVIVTSTASMLAYCYSLRELSDDYFSGWDWSNIDNATSAYSGSRGYLCQDCYSLRQVPMEFWKHGNPVAAYSNAIYYSGFYNCYSLDELVNIPFPHANATWTSNAFYNAFNNCYRLKNIIFATQEGDIPYSVNWKSQTIDLSNYVGYTTQVNKITNYNSGITANKEVKDDATYQALKNDPDWFASNIAYSRYNKESALATINSLPDTSAYGTNTIKFKGAAGELTDGGAINTLTAEEIAIATAKGWTVTLV